MMTRKTVVTLITAVFFMALAVIWSIDTIKAQDSTTTGDITQGNSIVTNTGGATTYDAGSENTFSVGNTATYNEITESGYAVHPNVYLGGYAYGVNTGYSSIIHEDVKKNTRLLLNIQQKLDDLDARLARIEKALNIKPAKQVKVGSTETAPKKGTLNYSTN